MNGRGPAVAACGAFGIFAGAFTGIFFGVVAAFALATTPASAGFVTVTRVIDGDTVEIEGGERVRLLGIDAPEDKRIRKNRDGSKRLVPAQPFFLEAKNLLRELVAKKRVEMRVGSESVGYYGRTLAHLYLPGGADVQRELLRRGYAMVTAYPPNIAHLQAYAAIEAEACRAGRGLWSAPHFALQNLKDGAPIRSGMGRAAGVVTRVERRSNDVRVRIEDRLTLLIYRGAWRKYWPGENAESLVGRRLIARGRIKAAGRHHILRIRHPFMLRARECAAWQAAAN